MDTPAAGGQAPDLELVEHAPTTPYTRHDAARLLEEPHKAPWRTAFERDRAR
nr:deoxyguanosinetriphosphate triphosphohydrolase [Actinomycetales bacterium]